MLTASLLLFLMQTGLRKKAGGGGGGECVYMVHIHTRDYISRRPMYDYLLCLHMVALVMIDSFLTWIN